MTTPGLTVEETDASPVTGAATDTGTAMLVVEARRGPAVAREVRSFSELLDLYGPAVSYSFLHDAAETILNLGGSRLVVSRAVSPNAVAATANIGSNRLAITASSAGAWANDLQVAVVAGQAGGTYVLVVSRVSDSVELERSPDLADQLAAQDWARDRVPGEPLSLPLSKLIRAVPGSSSGNPPVASAIALTNGADDRGNVDNAAWIAAANRIGAEFGPGQILAPGVTTDPVHVALANHAVQRNRVALLDAVRGASVSQLISAASAIRTSVGARRCALFGQNARIPAASGTQTPRLVPYSVVQAGLTAAYDATGKLGDAVSNALGRAPSRYVLALDREFTDLERGQLNDAGVSVARTIRGTVTTYSNRSVAAASVGQVDYDFSAARTIMGLRSRLTADLEEYVQAKVDGQGSKLAEAQGHLEGDCKVFYDANALYGDAPEDAYVVETTFDPASQELTGRAEVTPSPSAQTVVLELARRPAS